MSVLSLLNPFGWFGSYRAKLTGGEDQRAREVAELEGRGRAVPVEAALQVSAFWSCVRLIAETIAALPLQLYENQDDGGRVGRSDHPLYPLLHDQPNADHTAIEMWEGAVAYMAVGGNAFIRKEYLGARLVALTLLRAPWMSVLRDTNGLIVYRYSDPIEGVTDYTDDQIMHLRGFGFGDVTGLSAIAFARRTLGIALAADEVADRTFANGMKMSGWFKYKGGNGILNPAQREQARKLLVDPYVGAGNAAKVGILEGDFDWIAASMPAGDAQLLESRRFGVEDVCRWLGVPPILIGHAAQGQTMWGSGVEQIMLGWLAMGLRPYLVRIEQAIKKHLIAAPEKGKLYAEYNLDALLRADSKTRTEMFARMAQNGIRTRNELRALDNLKAMKGGDSLTVQSNLLPIDKLGELATMPKEKPVEPGAEVENLDDPSRSNPDVPKLFVEVKSVSGDADDFQAVGGVIEFKFATDAELPVGEFRGYAAVFGNKDSHGDIIQPGAFKASLESRKASGRSLPMHVMHRFFGGDGLPVGVWKSIEEDDKGLRVHGKVSGAVNTDVGRLNWERIKDGAYPGMSIGYRAGEVEKGAKGSGVKRHLKTIDLLEISLVDDSSNAQALIEMKRAGVKGFNPDQGRDERGRWSASGGYSASDKSAHDRHVSQMDMAHAKLRVGINSAAVHLREKTTDHSFLSSIAKGLQSDSAEAEDARNKVNALRAANGDSPIPMQPEIRQAQALGDSLAGVKEHIAAAKSGTRAQYAQFKETHERVSAAARKKEGSSSSSSAAGARTSSSAGGASSQQSRSSMARREAVAAVAGIAAGVITSNAAVGAFTAMMVRTGLAYRDSRKEIFAPEPSEAEFADQVAGEARAAIAALDADDTDKGVLGEALDTALADYKETLPPSEPAAKTAPSLCVSDFGFIKDFSLV